MAMQTEADALHDHLETKSTAELLELMNAEDHKVAEAVHAQLPAIEALTDAFIETLASDNRVFYIGAGTSGRLGVVDASELPPTFGLPFQTVVGLIAGGDSAIRKAVEFAEDDTKQAWLDLLANGASPGDLVIGIAASGRTPYVVGGLQMAKANGLRTGCIVCTSDSSIAAEAQFPVEVLVGPEFITGSTRLKSGTAQKLVLICSAPSQWCAFVASQATKWSTCSFLITN
jgi:N-acetylmuramic acid 6-phosphate etherase